MCHATRLSSHPYDPYDACTRPPLASERPAWLPGLERGRNLAGSPYRSLKPAAPRPPFRRHRRPGPLVLGESSRSGFHFPAGHSKYKNARFVTVQRFFRAQNSGRWTRVAWAPCVDSGERPGCILLSIWAMGLPPKRIYSSLGQVGSVFRLRTHVSLSDTSSTGHRHPTSARRGFCCGSNFSFLLLFQRLHMHMRHGHRLRRCSCAMLYLFLRPPPHPYGRNRCTCAPRSLLLGAF